MLYLFLSHPLPIKTSKSQLDGLNGTISKLTKERDGFEKELTMLKADDGIISTLTL